MMHLRGHVGYRARGFTLIEMMVVMVFTTMILGIIVGLTVTHSRSVVRMESRVRQLEQLRLTADLMSTEIADVPRGAVLAAGPDSVAFRLPIAWGVVCGELNRHQAPVKVKKPKKGDPPPPTVYPHAALYLEPAPVALGAPLPDAFGLSDNGVDWVYFPVGDWPALGIELDEQAGNACLDAVPVKQKKHKTKQGEEAPTPPPTTYAAAFFAFPDYHVVTGLAPQERAVFAAFTTVSYFLHPDGDDLALYRVLGTGPAQLVSSPFTPNAGFLYRLANGTEVESVAGGALADIRSIRAALPARRLTDPRWPADSLEIAPWMPLYNSR